MDEEGESESEESSEQVPWESRMPLMMRTPEWKRTSLRMTVAAVAVAVDNFVVWGLVRVRVRFRAHVRCRAHHHRHDHSRR
jgi:hypothetical protein